MRFSFWIDGLTSVWVGDQKGLTLVSRHQLDEVNIFIPLPKIYLQGYLIELSKHNTWNHASKATLPTSVYVHPIPQ